MEWTFTCECWYSDHTYSIICPWCKRENEIDGKGNLIKKYVSKKSNRFSKEKS